MEVVAKAFLSYAHADNDREGGRILHLAELIRNEFESLTGTTIEIFTDSAEILWGEDFRARLNESIQETTFFIPVLSPTYFTRDECRKELKQFVTSASELGLSQLLLSIRYFQVADLREGSTDELKDIAARMQFEPWDGFRLLDENSAVYRTAVNKLATRLVQLTQRLEVGERGGSSPQGSGGALIPRTSPMPSPPSTDYEASEHDHSPDDDDDDAPGLIDLVSDVEPATQVWGATVSQLTPAAQEFNALITESAARMVAANGQPNSFAAKIVIAKKLAVDAEEPIQRLEQLSKEYATGLMRLDPALRALLEMVSDSAADENRSVFIASIQGLIDSSLEAAENLNTAAEAAKRNAKMSRDLRPVLRRYETAMRNIADGSSTIRAWQPLLDGAARASV